MLPLELIAEMISATVPGQLHWGRDGNLTATPMAMACDDASGTRTGPHAEHHTEALAAANFIAGPIVTGLEHGYKAGKTRGGHGATKGADSASCSAPKRLGS